MRLQCPHTSMFKLCLLRVSLVMLDDFDVARLPTYHSPCLLGPLVGSSPSGSGHLQPRVHPRSSLFLCLTILSPPSVSANTMCTHIQIQMCAKCNFVHTYRCNSFRVKDAQFFPCTNSDNNTQMLVSPSWLGCPTILCTFSLYCSYAVGAASCLLCFVTAVQHLSPSLKRSSKASYILPHPLFPGCYAWHSFGLTRGSDRLKVSAHKTKT